MKSLDSISIRFLLLLGICFLVLVSGCLDGQQSKYIVVKQTINGGDSNSGSIVCMDLNSCIIGNYRIYSDNGRNIVFEDINGTGNNDFIVRGTTSDRIYLNESIPDVYTPGTGFNLGTPINSTGGGSFEDTGSSAPDGFTTLLGTGNFPSRSSSTEGGVQLKSGDSYPDMGIVVEVGDVLSICNNVSQCGTTDNAKQGWIDRLDARVDIPPRSFILSDNLDVLGLGVGQQYDVMAVDLYGNVKIGVDQTFDDPGPFGSSLTVLGGKDQPALVLRDNPYPSSNLFEAYDKGGELRTWLDSRAYLNANSQSWREPSGIGIVASVDDSGQFSINNINTLAGSASAPGYRFTDCMDCGWYYDFATSQVRLSRSSVDKIRVDVNVSIDTNTNGYDFNGQRFRARGTTISANGLIQPRIAVEGATGNFANGIDVNGPGSNALILVGNGQNRMQLGPQNAFLNVGNFITGYQGSFVQNIGGAGGDWNTIRGSGLMILGHGDQNYMFYNTPSGLNLLNLNANRTDLNISADGNVQASYFRTTKTLDYYLTGASNSQCAGVTTMVSGSVTVNTTCADNNYMVLVTNQDGAGPVGSVYVNSKGAGSFKINSTNVLDASQVYWEIRHLKTS